MTTQLESDPFDDGETTIETYYCGGAWHTRRDDCTRPYASGLGREELITVGVDVARWNGLRHVIRDPNGAIVEVNVYV